MEVHEQKLSGTAVIIVHNESSVVFVIGSRMLVINQCKYFQNI